MLRRWLMERRNEISAMGVKPTRKVLPRAWCAICVASWGLTMMNFEFLPPPETKKK